MEWVGVNFKVESKIYRLGTDWEYCSMGGGKMKHDGD